MAHGVYKSFQFHLIAFCMLIHHSYKTLNYATKKKKERKSLSTRQKKTIHISNYNTSVSKSLGHLCVINTQSKIHWPTTIKSNFIPTTLIPSMNTLCFVDHKNKIIKPELVKMRGAARRFHTTNTIILVFWAIVCFSFNFVLFQLFVQKMLFETIQQQWNDLTCYKLIYAWRVTHITNFNSNIFY